MVSAKSELEYFERLSFEEKLKQISSAGAKLEAKFRKGHLVELYSMGKYFVQVRYTANKPDQISAFLYNDRKLEFFLR